MKTQAKQTSIYISSGTGFVINHDGYAITSLHVVDSCRRIALSGTEPEREAQLLARDADNDLALLKTEAIAAENARFSELDQPPKAGDRAIIIGYPGQAAIDGHTVTRETQILDSSGPQGEEKWIQLGDVVEQGNSGGPLLNTAGNVIGVVTAKVMTYTYRKDHPENGTTRQFGVAVAIPVIKRFLEDHHINYQTSDANDYFSVERIADNTAPFIVNVRCYK